MITISLKIFPNPIKGRRGSFVGKSIQINTLNPIVKDIFDTETEITIDSYKIARGVSFLKLEDKIEDGDSFNAIPY